MADKPKKIDNSYQQQSSDAMEGDAGADRMAAGLPAVAAAGNTMDPMLRAAGKLDRLLAKMPEDVRTWALAYLQIKYKAKT